MDSKVSVDFSTVTEFERQIAEFFGAPYAVAVDSCTHGIELCLRYQRAVSIECPKNTYLSVPMLAKKIGIELIWEKPMWGNVTRWQKMYSIGNWILDAATYWQRNGYIPGHFMCLSFQHQKHLSLGRGGMILCPDETSYKALKRMSYDGREPGVPWREQNIQTMGYHYYMTPETAALGLQKLPEAIATKPRIWGWEDYPDLTKMDVFKNK